MGEFLAQILKMPPRRVSSCLKVKQSL